MPLGDIFPLNFWDIDTSGLMCLGQGGDIGYDSLTVQHTPWYKFSLGVAHSWINFPYKRVYIP
jgi:hypothetical protein